MPRSQKLNAVALKGALWETLQAVKSGKMDPGEADAIAGQAREILRTTRVQCQVLRLAAEDITDELVLFADPKSDRR